MHLLLKFTAPMDLTPVSITAPPPPLMDNRHKQESKFCFPEIFPYFSSIQLELLNFELENKSL